MQPWTRAVIFQGLYLIMAVYQSAPIPDPKISNYFEEIYDGQYLFHILFSRSNPLFPSPKLNDHIIQRQKWSFNKNIKYKSYNNIYICIAQISVNAGHLLS